MKQFPSLSSVCSEFNQTQRTLFNLLIERYCILKEIIMLMVDQTKYSFDIDLGDDDEFIIEYQEFVETESLKDKKDIIPLSEEFYPIFLDKLNIVTDFDIKGEKKFFPILELEENLSDASNLKKKITGKDRRTVKRIFRKNFYLLTARYHAHNFIESVEQVLRNVAEGKNLYDDIVFKSYVDRWNVFKLVHARFGISKEGVVIENNPFEESYFIKAYDEFDFGYGKKQPEQSVDFGADWAIAFVELPVIYFLICYFKDKQARHLIKECDW